MPRKAYKFRLYPTSAQERTLCQTLETCRGLYNSLLSQRKHDYEVLGKSPSFCTQAKQLPGWKKDHPELCEVNAQVLQNVAKRLDLTFEAFFRRVALGEEPGYPRTKGLGQYDSITYPQVGAHGGAQLAGDQLYLSKIGTLEVVLHRPVEGTIKTCTVRRQGDKWFVCFCVEVEEEPLPPSSEAVGIDVGLETFAALSQGELVENPRFFRKEEKGLAKAQRKLARQKRGSRERKKTKKVVGRIHERIRHRRHNFAHQTARKLVNRYGLIAVEALNVSGMVQNHCLAKSISDAAWSLFRTVLTSKAESAGRQVVNVKPAYTSQDCSGCGMRVPKALWVRVHVCPCCGLVLDRDVNAARNLLKIAVGLYSFPD